MIILPLFTPLLFSMNRATSMFSLPWSLRTLEGRPKSDTPCWNRLKTLDALLLLRHSRYMMERLYPSTQPWNTILHLTNLWFPSICLYKRKKWQLLQSWKNTQNYLGSHHTSCRINISNVKLQLDAPFSLRRIPHPISTKIIHWTTTWSLKGLLVKRKIQKSFSTMRLWLEVRDRKTARGQKTVWLHAGYTVCQDIIKYELKSSK